MNQKNDIRSVLISFNVVLSVILIPLLMDYIKQKTFLQTSFQIIILIYIIIILQLGWFYLAKTNEINLESVKRGYVYAIVCGFFFVVLPYPMSIMIIFISFGGLNALNYITKKRIKKTKLTLNQKVAYDLGLGNIEHKKIRLPFKFIGGFMTPLIPTQIVENTNRNKSKDMSRHEIIIHELMHIKIMKTLFIPFIVIIVFISIGLFSLEMNYIFTNFIMILIISFCMTMNERITFSATRKYTIKKRLKMTRKFTWKLFRDYMVLYIVQITILITFISGIRWLLSKIIV